MLIINKKDKGRRHLLCPDAHARPGESLERFRWLGNLIMDTMPDVIIDIGDWWDMESLCSYDKGTKAFEGRRYKHDIEAGHEADALAFGPIVRYNNTRSRLKKKHYSPLILRTTGNHEQRISRAIQRQPELDGAISMDDLRCRLDLNVVVSPFLKPHIVDDIAYCLSPKHLVLTADLKYVPLGDLKVGDKIVGFDEFSLNKRDRKYRTSMVEKHDRDHAELFRVRLSDGKEFDVTAEHQWFVRTGNSFTWTSTSLLTTSTELIKLLPEWQQEKSYEAGWLAGMFDGEGWFSRPNIKQGGVQIGIAQNEGPTLYKIHELLTRFGVQFSSNPHVKCKKVQVLGTSGEKLRLLGVIRPERLISKFEPEKLGRVQKPDNNSLVTVVSVTPLGLGEIVKIQTSTKTMIVEGYGHHNCHYFVSGVMGKPIGSAAQMLKKQFMSCTAGHMHARDWSEGTRADGVRMQALICGAFHDPDHHSSFADPQAQGLWWSGIHIKHSVLQGQYDREEISVERLRERYS